MRLPLDLRGGGGKTTNTVIGSSAAVLFGSGTRCGTACSPVLAAQDQDHQAVPSDAHDENERVDHRQEDPLEVSSHDVLHAARLFQVPLHLPGAGAGTRAGVVVVVLQDNVLREETQNMATIKAGFEILALN